MATVFLMAGFVNVVNPVRHKVESGLSALEYTPNSDIERYKTNSWYIGTVDDLGDVGTYSSIAVDSQDRPHISYQDITNRHPIYASYDNGSWSRIFVSQNSLGAQHTSLALDGNDNPHICYKEDAFVPQLMYSYHDGQAWTHKPIGFQLGHYLSIAVDNNDDAHITSYEFGGSLIYTTDLLDHDPIIETVDDEQNVGRDTSIEIDDADHPHISYLDVTNGNLKYAYHNGTSWVNETVDSSGDVGYYTSLDLDSNNHPHISYLDLGNDRLKYAYFDGAQWHNQTLDPADGQATSIALDGDDRPHISYKSNGLMYAYFDGAEWNHETIEQGLDFGDHSSIALDSYDNPHISYYDNNNKDLKYAVIDDIFPSLDGDSSPSFGTTGDPFTFNVELSDNIAVDSASVEWDHGILGNNDSLVKNGNDWEYIIELDHDLDHLSYRIHMMDAAGNYNFSETFNVPVVDNDLPELQSDNSVNLGFTGNTFEINISASDNIGVQWVSANWSHDNRANEMNLTLTGQYWIGVLELNDSTDDLVYSIRIADTSSNILSVIPVEITIGDDDPPAVYQDMTVGNPRTGEGFVLSLRTRDNIEVDSVSVGYSFNGEMAKNDSMVQGSSSIWNASIVVPVNAEILRCSYIIMDVAGNINQKYNRTLNVTDIISPVAEFEGEIHISQNQTAYFDGSSSSDNIGIVNYTWNFTYMGFDYILYGLAPNFTFDEAGVYTVQLMVRDKYENTDSENFSVYCSDITPPVAEAGSDWEISQSHLLILNASASTDNAEIVDFAWAFQYNRTNYNISGKIIEFRFDIPGIYIITLTVKDSAGLTDEDNLLVVVLDVTFPLANFTVNGNLSSSDTLILNLNRPVELDAEKSIDNVGIENYSWIISGNDLLWYGFGIEMEYQFDTAGNYTIELIVTDAAGNTNSREIEVKIEEQKEEDPDGVSPDDKEEKSNYNSLLLIIAALVVLIVIIGVLFILFRRLKGPDENRDDETTDNTSDQYDDGNPDIENISLDEPSVNGEYDSRKYNDFTMESDLPSDEFFEPGSVPGDLPPPPPLPPL